MAGKDKADVKREAAEASLRPSRSLLFFLPVLAVALMMGAAMFFYSRSDGSGVTITPSSSVSESAPKAASPKSAATVSGTAASPAAAAYSFPADINKAPDEQILACPGLNKKAAESLLRYRESVGTIHDLNELRNISGIGKKTLAAIAESFYVSETDTLTTSTAAAPAVTAKATTTTAQKTTKATTAAPKPEKPQPSTTAPAPPPPERRMVNINLADAEEIAEALLITRDQADKIVEMRGKIHGYRSPTEICLIDGFSTEFVLEIRDHITVELPEEEQTT